ACVHQQLEQGVLAEAMGFEYLWLTEHNFTGECAYADPIPFAGALAARTSRARLGFAVIQMALHHPVRLAIQLAVLDNLSRGRLEAGGHDAATRRRLLGEASVWRFLHVADSEAEAEDDVQEATLRYREHMHHVRDAYNPPDFRVNAAAINPWMDPTVSHPDG